MIHEQLLCFFRQLAYFLQIKYILEEYTEMYELYTASYLQPLTSFFKL